jgi:ABC-2 type transport system permease protein
MKKIYVLTKKEFWHLSRDLKLSLILALFPIFLLIFFGYAINFDIKNVRISIVDNDHSELSREIILYLKNSSYFSVQSIDEKLAYKKFVQSKIDASLIIPNNFSKNLNKNLPTSLQVCIIGTDANAAKIISRYFEIFANSISTKINQKLYSNKNIDFSNLINITFKYNPTLNTTIFFMPGLIAMILIVISVVAVSLSFVKEKEMGTIEQLIISPITEFEYILSKILPYAILSLFEALALLIFAYLVFDVPFRGSLFDFIIVSIVYLICGLLMGLFISTISNAQQTAFLISALISLLPTFLLSGFVFNIDSMPKAIQILTNLTPAKFYISALRNIMIRGSSFKHFWLDFFYLVIFANIALIAVLYVLKKQKKNYFES